MDRESHFFLELLQMPKLVITNLKLICSCGLFLLAVLLIFHCIATCSALCSAVNGTLAVTNSRTTLLQEYGPAGNVLTTLEQNVCLILQCRVQDAFVYDDPYWLLVTVPDIGIQGWVADYYADCGYVGYCQVQMC